jgi:hypothetical protein
VPARQRPPSAARALLPDRPDLDGLRAAAANCQACDLILRAPDDEARALAYKGFVADPAVAAGELGRGSPSE